MAKLLTGTRIYGTGTVDTQLFVSGTNSATSTTTGALQVVGGVGVGGNLHVGGIIYGAILGTATTATNADNVKTVLQTSSASHYLTFVDANNSTAAYEALYTTSSFVINPQSGFVGIGTASPSTKLHVYESSAADVALRLTPANGSYDALLQMTGANGAIATEGFEIWYSNNVGDVRIATTYPNDAAAIRFHTRTGASKSTSNERLTIAGNGNVGIGTNSPSYPLHLLTTSTTSAAFRNSTSTTTQILIGNTAGDTTIRTLGSGDSFIFSDTSKYLAFGTGATERLRITANGGISFGGSGTAYGVSGQILQSNGDAAPTWISTGSLAAANATTATHLSGGTAGQVPYQTAPGATSFYGPGTAGDVLVSNGTSAPSYNNTLTLAGTTAATSTTTGTLVVVGGVGIGDNLFVNNNINAVSGQFVSTRANNAATGAGQIYLNGASGNRIDFNQNGVAAPAFTTRSAGTKLVLYSNLSGSAVDYAIGIESSSLWSSVPNTGSFFKWYGGTTLAAQLSGTGNLTLVGDLAVNGGDITTTQATFNLINTTATTVNFAGSATTLTMGASGSGTTNVRNNLTVSGNLTVQGTTTIVDSTVTNIADPIITLGGGTGNTAPTADDNKDRGVAFKWVNDGGTTSTGFFGYDDSTGYFTYVQTATITNEVVSGTKGAMDVNLAGGSAMAIVYQSSPNNTAFLAAGSSGFILQTNGTGSPPTWVSAGGVSAGSATNADNIRTILQTGNASHFLTFVDSNNASHAYESVYTTSSFSINPATGAVNVTGTITASNSVTASGTGASGGFRLHTNSGITASNNYMNFFTGQTTGWSFNANGTGADTNQVAYITASGGAYFAGNVGIGTTSTGAKLDVQAGDGGDSRSIQSVLPGSGSYNPAVSNTPGKVVSGIKFNWYSDNWQIGAARSGATSVDGFVISRNNTSTVVITANGALAFGLPTSYGSSGQILQSNGDAAPTWVTAISGSSAQVNTVLRTTSAAHYLTFVDSNNASATAESIYTTSSFVINPQSGSVGIGTSSPAQKLDVRGYIVSDVNSNSVEGGFYLGNSGHGIRRPVSTNDVYVYTTGGTLYLTANGSTSTQVTILNSGNVGIGAAPTAVTGFGINRFLEIAGSSVPGIVFRPTGSTSEHSILGAGDGLLLGATGAATASGNNVIRFFTSNVNSSNAPTERLRITAAGGIAFGGSTNYGSAGQMLQSNGDAAPTWVALSSRTVGTSTQVNTVLQASNASYYPTFVDSNNASATAESFYTTSSFQINPFTGNIQIGMTSQDYQPSSGGNHTLRLNAANTSSIGFHDSGSTIGNLKFSGNYGFEIGAYDGLYGPHNTTLHGNVGIGTLSPGYPLVVQTNGTSASPSPSGSNIALRLQSTQTNYAVSIQFSDNVTNAAFITMQGGGFRFTTSNPGAVQAVNISSSGNVSIGTTSTTNKFEVAGTAGQLFSVSDSFTGTIFSVNDVSGIPSIEVLDTGLVKLAQYNGAVTIGTGTVSSSTAELSVYGMLYTSGAQGEIRASSEITAYFSSDRRLKENIKLIENPITIIDQIRGVTFDWTDEHMARRGGEDGYFVRKHDIGVIAQEVQAVLPELVGTREDGYLAVKYEKMVPLLIEAIKTQQKTIDSLVKDLDDVKEYISQLKIKNGI